MYASNSFEILNLLLFQGANINDESASGDTALTKAMQGALDSFDCELVRFLLLNGANLKQNSVNVNNIAFQSGANWNLELSWILQKHGSNCFTIAAGFTAGCVLFGPLSSFACLRNIPFICRSVASPCSRCTSCCCCKFRNRHRVRDAAEENPAFLGLSSDIAVDYSNTMDMIESWIDQPKVLDLDSRIQQAKIDLNPALQMQLIQQKKALKVFSDRVLTQNDILYSTQSLQNKVKHYYDNQTKMDNFDVVLAQNCSKTLHFVNELTSAVVKVANDSAKGLTNNINNAELVAVVSKRYKHKAGVNDNFVFPDHVRRIDWSDVKVSSTKITDVYIAEGSFASVYKAKLVVAGGLYDVAIKIYNQKFDGEYNQACVDALKEADTVAKISNSILNKDNIVGLYGVVLGLLTPELTVLFNLRDGTSRVGLVMNLESGGSLEGLLYPSDSKLTRSLSLESQLSILKDVVSGLREIHSVSAFHGDIKPQNILLSDSVSLKARLADFGLSDIRVGRLNSAQASAVQMTNMTKGTILYCAPEMLKHPSNVGAPVAKASRSTDMYAFAFLVWELLVGKKPFSETGLDEFTVITKVHNGERPDIKALPGGTPPGIIAMIESCWDADRDKRVTATECYSIISHNLHVVNSKNFDIFFSHAWVDKRVLSYVFAWLTSLGYRVWYDQNEMGYDLQASMREGIAKSTIVLVCVNSTYQSRQNCMFELKETARLHPNKKIVSLILESRTTWAPSMEMDSILKFNNHMYCDISGVAADPLWKMRDHLTPDLQIQFKKLIGDLALATQPLVNILNNVQCMPSIKKK